MKSSHDPNLTSWALNELSPAERAAFKEELKKNPALMAEAQTTQNFCRFVQNHLRDEKAVLTDAQRMRLKSAARANSKHMREEQKPHGNVIHTKPHQWWQRPALVLPLSAAAAIMIGFLPYLRQKMSPDHLNAETVAVIPDTVTPRPEPKRSVLSPTTTSEPDAMVVTQQFPAGQLVKPVAEVGAQPGTPHEPLEISAAQLKAGASGAVNSINSGTGTPTLVGHAPEAGAALKNGVTNMAKIDGGGVLKLTGINTYTGGMAVNGGVVLVGLSNAPTSSGYFGEPTTTRGTVNFRVGRLNRTTSDSISELGDLSDISEKANIIVNGGVPPPFALPDGQSR